MDRNLHVGLIVVHTAIQSITLSVHVSRCVSYEDCYYMKEEMLVGVVNSRLRLFDVLLHSINRFFYKTNVATAYMTSDNIHRPGSK